jgi:hypothetical protein
MDRSAPVAIVVPDVLGRAEAPPAAIDAVGAGRDTGYLSRTHESLDRDALAEAESEHGDVRRRPNVAGVAGS